MQTCPGHFLNWGWSSPKCLRFINKWGWYGNECKVTLIFFFLFVQKYYCWILRQSIPHNKSEDTSETGKRVCLVRPSFWMLHMRKLYKWNLFKKIGVQWKLLQCAHTDTNKGCMTCEKQETQYHRYLASIQWFTKNVDLRYQCWWAWERPEIPVTPQNGVTWQVC